MMGPYYSRGTKQARPKLAHIGRAETVTAAGTAGVRETVTVCCLLVSVGRGDRIRIGSCALRVHVDWYVIAAVGSLLARHGL